MKKVCLSLLLALLFYSTSIQFLSAQGNFTCKYDSNTRSCNLDTNSCAAQHRPGDCSGLSFDKTTCEKISYPCVNDASWKYCDPGTGNSRNGVDTAIGCIPINDLSTFAAFFLKLAIGVGGGIAFLFMVIGAFQITSSSGDPDRLKGGQELITSALIGLLMIVFSVFLLKLIGVDILQIPGF